MENKISVTEAGLNAMVEWTSWSKSQFLTMKKIAERVRKLQATLPTTKNRPIAFVDAEVIMSSGLIKQTLEEFGP